MAWNKLKSDERVISLIFFLVVIGGLMYPVILPSRIEPELQSFIDIVELYGEDGIYHGEPLLLNYMVPFTQVGEMRPITRAFIQSLRELDVHFIVWAPGGQGEVGQTKICEGDLKNVWPDWPNVPGYGEKFVYLGWTGPQAMPIVYADFFKAFGYTDYYGNSLEDMPIMQNHRDLYSIGTFVGLGDQEDNPWPAMEPFLKTPKKRILVSAEGGQGSLQLMMEIGWAHGGLLGARWGAAYEGVMGIPGTNSAVRSTTVFATIFTFAGIIVANIQYYLKRRES